MELLMSLISCAEFTARTTNRQSKPVVQPLIEVKPWLYACRPSEKPQQGSRLDKVYHSQWTGGHFEHCECIHCVHLLGFNSGAQVHKSCCSVSVLTHGSGRVKAAVLGWPWAAPQRWELQTSPRPDPPCCCLQPDQILHPPPPNHCPPSCLWTTLVMRSRSGQLQVGGSCKHYVNFGTCVSSAQAGMHAGRLGSEQLGSTLLSHLTCPEQRRHPGICSPATSIIKQPLHCISLCWLWPIWEQCEHLHTVLLRWSSN